MVRKLLSDWLVVSLFVTSRMPAALTILAEAAIPAEIEKMSFIEACV